MDAFEYIIKQFQESINNKTSHLVGGRCDEGEYKKLSGEIISLQWAINIVKEVSDRFESEE